MYRLPIYTAILQNGRRFLVGLEDQSPRMNKVHREGSFPALCQWVQSGAGELLQDGQIGCVTNFVQALEENVGLFRPELGDSSFVIIAHFPHLAIGEGDVHGVAKIFQYLKGK